MAKSISFSYDPNQISSFSFHNCLIKTKGRKIYAKHKKWNWKRPVAGLLAVLIAAGTVDISQFGAMTSYAYSKDYGICTDNHLYSDAGSNCSGDLYVRTTELTQDLQHGSPEWQEVIIHNLS